RNQGSHFPSLQARSHKNSAFIRFLDYFRKVSSLGKETRSPITSTFLYSSLLYSTFLYPIASWEQFAICIFQFSSCNPSYLPSPKPSPFLSSPLLSSPCLYPIASREPICNLHFSIFNLQIPLQFFILRTPWLSIG